VSAKEKRIRLVCEKFIIFSYRQYISGIVITRGFKNIPFYKIEVGNYEKFGKM